MTDPEFPIGPDVLEPARRALGRGLCPECFGRLFGRAGHGLTNPERAARISEALGPLARADLCPVCEGAFDRIPVWVERCEGAGADYEWARFACGSRWDPEALAREEALWLAVGTSSGESLHSAFNRELGKRLEAASGAEATTARPEVVFLADLPVGRVSLTVMPLYFRGRYRKLDRTLPQTRWPCRSCHGVGCDRCGGTGKTYPTSVEELVAAPFLPATGAEGTRFHGMGREDIDARMLGRGRPFVLELRRPKHRTIRLADVVEEGNKGATGRVELLDVAPTDAADVVRVKEALPMKSYRVGVAGIVALANLNEALTFATSRAIAQRTPTRVAHRRADRVRTRRIVSASIVEAAEGRFTLDLRAEAGTYIKEWVEGDDGRTDPSLSGLLGAPLTVEFLDVLDIHDEETGR
ncbi:MAG TPA: tRNA pseudouridine(54/55) synthase Pus10 [Thermoplasmata archaeon]|nr:tRNA pseudouridine(54/55) synthase Pus10 [Thermoplasmata archaeon]